MLNIKLTDSNSKISTGVSNNNPNFAGPTTSYQNVDRAQTVNRLKQLLELGVGAGVLQRYQDGYRLVTRRSERISGKSKHPAKPLVNITAKFVFDNYYYNSISSSTQI